MPADEPLGLRERKRLATRAAIQHAVLRLALDRGLENVTIDEISREADISQRTFFNYFVSKDAALMGEMPRLPDNDAAERFATGGPAGALLPDLGTLLVAAADHAMDDRETILMRRELNSRYPQLLGQRMAGMRALEQQISGLVERRLAHDDASISGDPVALSSRAHLITMVAFGALRHAWTRWADADSGTAVPLPELMRESFAQLGGILVQESAA